MIDSARLGAVVDEGTGITTELVVEGDGGGQAAEPGEDSFSESWEGSGAVALEGEEVLAGPEDRFDPLADWREVRALTGFVLAAGTADGCAQLVALGSELSAGVALVTQQRLSALALAALQHDERDIALIDLRRGDLQRAWGAIRREDRVQAKPPEIPGMRRAPAVVGGVRQRGAPDRLAATSALHRGGVDQQQLVVEPGALAG